MKFLVFFSSPAIDHDSFPHYLLIILLFDDMQRREAKHKQIVAVPVLQRMYHNSPASLRVCRGRWGKGVVCLLMWYPQHAMMVSGLKQTRLPFFPL